MSIDSIGDFLTIIRNGIMASKPFVIVPFSKIKHEIARILKDEGFIKDIALIEEDGAKKALKIVLKYINSESVIHEIKRASKPGIRRYAKVSRIEPVIGGLGLSILSTNKGIMSHKKAKEFGVGGEVICVVW